MRGSIREDGANVLAALGEPTRRHILDLLTDRGPASASTLARDVDISRQGLTKHLTTLLDAGVLTTERTGREVRYAVSPAALDAAAAWLDARARQWDAQLAALKQLAEGGG